MSFWDLFNSGREKPSPQDWLPIEAVTYHEGVGRLDIDLTRLKISLSAPPKVWTPFIPATRSMDPVSDIGNNNIYIAGANEADHKKLVDFLKVGDVAVYRFPSEITSPALAFNSHRIAKIGSDSKGRYFRFKGDNNSGQDGWTPRDENIKWISIGVIY